MINIKFWKIILLTSWDFRDIFVIFCILLQVKSYLSQLNNEKDATGSLPLLNFNTLDIVFKYMIKKLITHSIYYRQQLILFGQWTNLLRKFFWINFNIWKRNKNVIWSTGELLYQYYKTQKSALLSYFYRIWVINQFSGIHFWRPNLFKSESVNLPINQFLDISY